MHIFNTFFKSKKTIAILFIMVLLFGSLAVAFGSWLFPYGSSHSCDSALHFSLRLYAEANGGAFPSGEDSPEASLSLLSRPPWNVSAEILRGKTVSKRTIEDILKRGDLLSPETCGWHYVEGLYITDNPRLALFWDKVGLGHNGQRLLQGGHFVATIGNPHEYVPASEWSQFLKDQEAMREEQRALHNRQNVR